MMSKQTDVYGCDKDQIDKIDESLREKYLEIVQSLSIDELKRFNKDRYKKLVISDMQDLLSGADKSTVEYTAHYISNMLNNEAERQRGYKQANKRRQNRTSTDGGSKQVNASKCTGENNITNKMSVMMDNLSDIPTQNSTQNKLTNSIIVALDETLSTENVGFDSSITCTQLDESTFTDSHLDETYETIHDDSITFVKDTVQTKAQSTSRSKHK